MNIERTTGNRNISFRRDTSCCITCFGDGTKRSSCNYTTRRRSTYIHCISSVRSRFRINLNSGCLGNRQYAFVCITYVCNIDSDCSGCTITINSIVGCFYSASVDSSTSSIQIDSIRCIRPCMTNNCSSIHSQARSVVIYTGGRLTGISMAFYQSTINRNLCRSTLTCIYSIGVATTFTLYYSFIHRKLTS